MADHLQERHDGMSEPIPISFMVLTETRSDEPAIRHLWLGPLDVPRCWATSCGELTGRATVVAVMS